MDAMDARRAWRTRMPVVENCRARSLLPYLRPARSDIFRGATGAPTLLPSRATCPALPLLRIPDPERRDRPGAHPSRWRPPPGPPPRAALERSIGFVGATGIGVAAIVGGGIFVLGGVAVAQAGPAAVLAFALNGAIAFLTALAFAELATAFPENGGQYVYARRTFSVQAAFGVGWVMTFAHVVAAVLYALGFAAYAVAAARGPGPDVDGLLEGERLGGSPWSSPLLATGAYGWRLTRGERRGPGGERGQARGLRGAHRRRPRGGRSARTHRGPRPPLPFLERGFGGRRGGHGAHLHHLPGLRAHCRGGGRGEGPAAERAPGHVREPGRDAGGLPASPRGDHDGGAARPGSPPRPSSPRTTPRRCSPWPPPPTWEPSGSGSSWWPRSSPPSPRSGPTSWRARGWRWPWRGIGPSRGGSRPCMPGPVSRSRRWPSSA
jgi:hypothetical protein